MMMECRGKPLLHLPTRSITMPSRSVSVPQNHRPIVLFVLHFVISRHCCTNRLMLVRHLMKLIVMRGVSFMFHAKKHCIISLPSLTSAVHSSVISSRVGAISLCLSLPSGNSTVDVKSPSLLGISTRFTTEGVCRETREHRQDRSPILTTTEHLPQALYRISQKQRLHHQNQLVDQHSNHIPPLVTQHMSIQLSNLTSPTMTT
mmetsp:Transcript_10109/g.14516  ORF Transcript_10109/g.14516 Transcript_10109/m.14516 type:complete len:203 (-) Transcript_10109:653-1261(-)